MVLPSFLVQAAAVLADIQEVVALALHITKLLEVPDQEVAGAAAVANITKEVVGVVELDCMAKEPVALLAVAPTTVNLDPVATIFTMEVLAPEAAMADQEPCVYYGEPDEHFLVLM
jgi:hypothetical protein